MTEIIYESQCQTCLTHKTDLGSLRSIYDSILLQFPDIPITLQLELIKLFYEQYKLDKRTEFISQQKKDTTAQIQKYKVSNIAKINDK